MRSLYFMIVMILKSTRAPVYWHESDSNIREVLSTSVDLTKGTTSKRLCEAKPKKTIYIHRHLGLSPKDRSRVGQENGSSNSREYPRKMGQHFPIKPGQQRAMALTIFDSFSKFPT